MQTVQSSGVFSKNDAISIAKTAAVGAAVGVGLNTALCVRSAKYAINSHKNYSSLCVYEVERFQEYLSKVKASPKQKLFYKFLEESMDKSTIAWKKMLPLLVRPALILAGIFAAIKTILVLAKNENNKV